MDRFTIGTDRLVLETDTFAFSSNETVPRGRNIISGHRTLLKDGDKVGAFQVESGDAEINDLYTSDKEVRLVMLWHSYTLQISTVCVAYRCPGAALRIEAEDGGPLVPFVSSNET